MSSKTVLLEGFLVSIHCPSEERCYLTVEASHLKGRQLIEVVDELQDLIAEINEAYSKKGKSSRALRTIHSRREIVRGSEVKIVRKRFIRFPIVPTSIISTMNKVRQYIYSVHRGINKFGLIIQSIGSEKARRNLYLLPFNNAPEFMFNVSELNKELEEAEKNANAFMQTIYYETLRKYVKEKFNTNLPSKISLGRIEVDLTPISLTQEYVEKLIEEKYRKILEKLEEKEKRGLMEIQRELERKRRNLIRNAILELDRKLRNIIASIVEAEYNKKIVSIAWKKVEEIEQLAKNIGLEALAETVTGKIKTIISTIEKGEIEKAVEIVKNEYGIDIKELRKTKLEKVPARIKALFL